MKKGIVLIEVLLATAILGALLVPILDFFVTSIESNWFASREVKAQGLILEQLEALRSIRERNWEELGEGSYYLTATDGTWKLAPSEEGETTGPFTRKTEILPVYRDQNDLLVEAGDPGARLDPSTKKITASVSWQALRDRSLTVNTYLTRYLDNLVWKQTTKEEFDQGEMELTKTIDPPEDDGEVILEGGCFTESPESLIYDDELKSGWRVNCQGLSFWRWLICIILQFFSNSEIQLDATEYTWDDSPYSMKITLRSYGWSWVGLYNFDAVCTKGFKNLHFYAYNPSTEEITFYLTAVYQEWETAQIDLPPQEWTEVSIDYEVLEEYENNLRALYFHKWMPEGEPDLVFYIDQIELTGGVGGYFTQGTLTSSVFDAGRTTAFNRISFNANVPSQTEIGFQTATANSSEGPWVFYGPGGTTETNDLYTDPEGEGIWLGNNFGRFFRYKAYLRSLDGESTPTLYDVTINYSP